MFSANKKLPPPLGSSFLIFLKFLLYYILLYPHQTIIQKRQKEKCKQNKTYHNADGNLH